MHQHLQYKSMRQQLQYSTDIYIYSQGELLCHTHNKLTRMGKYYIHKLLTTTANINKIALSYLQGTVTEDTVMFNDADLYDITNTYFTVSSGQIIMNFEANIPSPPSGKSLYRLGLAISDDVLFTVANAGGIGVGGNPLTVLYQIGLKITEVQK